MMTRTHCYCGLPKFDGKCEYDCSPYADPDWLRLQAAKRRERDHHARLETYWTITVEDHQRMNNAVARFDPFYRRALERKKRAGRMSHAAGNRRKAS